ncbi:MAG: hypothetical protein WAL66_15265 [Nitrososphaeraceae archaeon]
MKVCKICKRTKFFSLNFIFSVAVCNDCYFLIKEIGAAGLDAKMTHRDTRMTKGIDKVVLQETSDFKEKNRSDTM